MIPVSRILLFLLLPIASIASAQSAGPSDWLDRMSTTVSTIDFEGTVIRRRDGESQALKVVRKIVDGVVQEKLVSQEGNGLEIIRNGTEVYCILPDKQSVLVEYWNDDVTLFSTLPSSELQFGSEYDLSIVREERVAGRPSILLAVRPHDGYRYGYKIWLDRETAFPLRTELVGGDGSLLEQLKFADIRLSPDIPPEALEPSFDLQGYTWYPEAVSSESEQIVSEWVSDDLPPGFREISATAEQAASAAPAVSSTVTHLMFSDGLAKVSVFIELAAENDSQLQLRGALGGSSSAHSVESGGYRVTAIGEVPQATVRRIAVSMKRRQ